MRPATVFVEKAIAQIPRLLSQLDRNPYSPTYGCFSWEFWHLKSIPVPSAHTQEAVLALAFLYKNNFTGNDYFNHKHMLEWARAAMLYWTGLQHKDGSFDEFYLNEKQLGATAVTLFSVLESYSLLKDELSEQDKKIILKACKKAAAWLSSNDEAYLLSNHQAQCLVALRLANDIFANEFIEGEKYRLNRIKDAYCREGWLPEYNGLDPGYLTTTLSFLARYHEKTGDASINDIIDGMVALLSCFIFPDSSFGGVMGSRNTSHFWPYGFFIAAQKGNGLAARILEKAADGIERQRILSPEQGDYYFWEQIYDFLQTALYDQYFKKRKPLPYEGKDFALYLEKAGFLIRKNLRRYAVISLRKGGVIKVFNGTNLVYSDSGIFGRLSSGEVITTMWLEPSYEIKSEKDSAEVSGNFSIISFPKPSVIKLSGLNILSSLFGRMGLSGILKNVLIRKLVRSSSRSKVSFTRRFAFNKKITIENIVKANNVKVESLSIEDEIPLAFTAYAKYFQRSSLTFGSRPFSKKSMGELSNGECRLTLTVP